MASKDSENLLNLGEDSIQKLTPIQEFYTGTKILITGGTGFFGNILIDKLLRSCPTISMIYLLVRTKKGKDVQSRLNELFEDVVFERLRNEYPDFREKLVIIEGNCALPDLGLCVQDKSMLRDEVNIVFHVAATVRFDEKIKTAVAINIRATRDLLTLAHQMPKLKSFIHVSTLYSNCDKEVIEEKLYPAALDYNCLIRMTESVPEEILEKITPALLVKYPNTYAYSKQIAESIYSEEGNGLAIGIFRPSIVVSTYKEPIAGWINNFYGATGVTAGAYAGVLRALYCDPKCNANLVPVDMCVNSIIATAWEVGNTFKEAKKKNGNYEIPIYNYESSNDQPINWEQFMSICTRTACLYPSAKMIWFYSFYLYKSYYIYLLVALFKHFIPAIVFDAVSFCIGKSPRMLRLYLNIHKFSSVTSYFCLRKWTIKFENVRKLINKMSAEDRKIFFSDLKELNWDNFLHTYIIGKRIYLLKDPMETLPEALKKFNRFFWYHQITKAVVGILLLWILWYLFSKIYSVIY